MERKRTFVTTSLADSMHEVTQNEKCAVKIRYVSDVIGELKKYKLISALKDSDRALIGTLNDEYGINVEPNPIKVTLQVGDVLVVIKPPVGRIDLQEEDYLPEGVTISARIYEVWDDIEFAKAVLDGSLYND